MNEASRLGAEAATSIMVTQLTEGTGTTRSEVSKLIEDDRQLAEDAIVQLVHVATRLLQRDALRTGQDPLQILHAGALWLNSGDVVDD